MLSESEKLDSLSRLVIELNQVQDLDILMEHILSQARRFANADAGSIYIVDGDRLQFNYTQNQTLQERLGPDEKLIYSTFSLPIDEHSIAGYVAATGRPLNLTDVYQIDATLPFEFSKDFDEATQYKTQSVLTLPLKSANSHILGILQIINAQDTARHVVAFTAEDQKMMMHFASIAAVALERAQMTRDIILRMIRMAELRDPKETGAHVNRVGGFAVEIYEKWALRRGLPRKEIDKNRDVLRMAAMLHDVGKVAISDLILKKPGRFSQVEYEMMKQHTLLGAQLFLGQRSGFDEAASIVALSHHERWDGKGYPGYIDVETGQPIAAHLRPDLKPAGKEGAAIPLFGRIVALADVFDALSSARIYKEAWEEADVLATIESEAGHHFDPELVDIFFSCLDILRSIQKRYAEQESNG